MIEPIESFLHYLAVEKGYSEHTISAYRNDLTGLAQVVGHNCQVALAFDIPEDAQKVLSSLSTRPSIISALILAPSGKPFAAYSRDQLADGTAKQEATCQKTGAYQKQENSW